jgi:hypothetical protein
MSGRRTDVASAEWLSAEVGELGGRLLRASRTAEAPVAVQEHALLAAEAALGSTLLTSIAAASAGIKPGASAATQGTSAATQGTSAAAQGASAAAQGASAAAQGASAAAGGSMLGGAAGSTALGGGAWVGLTSLGTSGAVKGFLLAAAVGAAGATGSYLGVKTYVEGAAHGPEERQLRSPSLPSISMGLPSVRGAPGASVSELSEGARQQPPRPGARPRMEAMALQAESSSPAPSDRRSASQGNAGSHAGRYRAATANSTASGASGRKSVPAAPPAGVTLATASPSTSSADSALSGEVVLIRKALSLLRGDNPAGALAVLEQYEQRHPHGKLKPEVKQLRERARAAQSRGTDSPK